MHSGSLCLLGSPGGSPGPPCGAHCYVPVDPSLAFCAVDGSPAFGLCLPSSYQGNLWLLDDRQERYGDMRICQPETRTTSGAPRTCCVPCGRPAAGTAPETVGVGPGPGRRPCVGPSPRCKPRAQSKGHVSRFHAPGPRASAGCPSLSHGPQCLGRLRCLPERVRAPPHRGLASPGYRSYQDLGFTPGGLSPSCYVANSCQSQNYLVRNHQYPGYRPVSCQPLGCFSRNVQSRGCLPSTFPPLRYLRSGCRPLSCY